MLKDMIEMNDNRNDLSEKIVKEKMKNRNARVIFAVIIFIIISAFAMTESILNRQYGVQLYSIFTPLIFSLNVSPIQKIIFNFFLCLENPSIFNKNFT